MRSGTGIFQLLPRMPPVLWKALPSVNFITLHYAYFICTVLVSAVIFWASATPFRSVRFIDAIFLVTSAMTEAGLNTINLSTLNTFQQVHLLILTMIGSAIFVSAFVVQFRRRAFEHKFKDIIREQKSKRAASRSAPHNAVPFSRGPSGSLAGEKVDASIDRGAIPHNPSIADKHCSSYDQTLDNEIAMASQPRLTFTSDTRFGSSDQQDGVHRRRPSRSSPSSLDGVGARPDARMYQGTDMAINSANNHDNDVVHSAFPHATIGRNSEFSGLNELERDQLGGLEYRALIILSWLVPAYFVFWQLFPCIGLGAWIAAHRSSTAYENGVNPWFVGIFNGISAFNNNGMSLLDANMTAFQDAYYVLITMGVMILAGNTCYPIFLRLIIWCLHRIIPKTEAWTEWRAALQYLLDHPRRCYTNLFPARHTKWLVAAVVVLNGIDWAAFEILNIGNRTLDEELPTHLRIIDGLFQAIAVRSGGFYVVSIPTLRISLQILYVVMMYISVYPVVITMRNSNVYEERSLGIYSDDPFYEQRRRSGKQSNTIWGRIAGLGQHVSDFQESRSYFVRQQIRSQLAHDIWWLVLAVFLIMIIESSQFEDDPAVFSVFNFIFETVSAYGTVGISVGVPWADYSFCGAWASLSKLILCAVMLRGRHRGLPVAIDRAVLLPGETLGQAEEEDAMIRLERSLSRNKNDEP